MGRTHLQGVHSAVKYDQDGRTVWPVEEGEWRPKPRKTWSVGANDAPLEPPKFDFKEYEYKLLAAYARCYRGQATPKDLPMIPVDMAILIIRDGGLTDWIEGKESRLKRFWEMVRLQSQPRSTAPIKKAKSARGR